MGNAGKLTGKQRAFVHYWFAEKFNGTKAARLAGYHGSETVLGSVASENLRKPKIIAEVERRWAAHGMTPAEVVGRLTEQARCNIGDFVDDTGAVRFDVVKERGHLVKRVVHQKGQRSSIEIHDQQTALIQIGKTFGLFRDVHEQVGELIVNVNYGDDSDA
jgi:hypothetical protein